MKNIFVPIALVLVFSCSKKSDPTPITNTVTNTNTVTDTIYKQYTPKVVFGTVNDNQGASYRTVTLGGQTWMAENLRVQYYNNGDRIQTNTNIAGYSTESNPRYWFNPNSSDAFGNDDSIAVYGRLYTWYVATDHRGVCPSGWGIATDLEWQALIDTLGGANVAGNKMKEVGTAHWSSPNNGTNTSGFTARGAGLHSAAGGGASLPNNSTIFWTSSPYESDTTSAYGVIVGGSSVSITNTLSAIYGKGKNAAYSIRCKKH